MGEVNAVNVSFSVVERLVGGTLDGSDEDLMSHEDENLNES